MEPRIEYAKTADGVSIALWTVGEGMPLVYLTGGPWSHIELWQVPECRRWYGRLGQKKTLVRYDVRGTGLSERSLLATGKSGTVGNPRDQGWDWGLVSSLRALLCCLLRSMVWACTSFLRRNMSSRLPLRTSDGVTLPSALW